MSWSDASKRPGAARSWADATALRLPELRLDASECLWANEPIPGAWDCPSSGFLRLDLSSARASPLWAHGRKDDHVVHGVLGEVARGDDDLANAPDLHPLDGSFPAFSKGAEFEPLEGGREVRRPPVVPDLSGGMVGPGVVDAHFVATLGGGARPNLELPDQGLLGNRPPGRLEDRFLIALPPVDAREWPFGLVVPDDHLRGAGFEGGAVSLRVPSLIRDGGTRFTHLGARRLVASAAGDTDGEDQAERANQSLNPHLDFFGSRAV